MNSSLLSIVKSMLSKQIKIKIKKILYPFFNIFSKKYIVKRVNQLPNKSICVTQASLTLIEDIDYLRHQKLIDYNGSPKQLEAEINVYFYNDVYIDLYTGFLINKNKDLIFETIKAPHKQNPTDLANITNFTEINESLVAVINPYHNARYFHIWFDGLIKLYYLSKLKNRKVSIVYSQSLPKIYNEIFNLFKDDFNFLLVENSRFIKVKEACFVRNNYWCKHGPYISPSIRKYFTDKMFDNPEVHNLFEKKYDRVYIKRKENSRTIINNDEIENIFKEYGFEIISFEDYNLVEQAYIVNNCTIIAGLHGAGFTNLIFSNDKLIVIELQNYAIVPTFFFLSYQLNLKYFPVFSTNSQTDIIKDPYKQRKEFFRQKLLPTNYNINEIIRILEVITNSIDA